MSVQTASKPGSPQGARAQQEATVRWLRPVGVVIVAVVLIDGATERPAPGLRGDRLGVLLALLAFAIGLLGLREARSRRASFWVQAPLLGALVVGSGVLMWLQPSGPGFLGFFFLAACVATLGVPARIGAAAAGLVLVVLLAVGRAAAAHRPITGIVFSVLGLSGLYLVVVLAPRAGGSTARRAAARGARADAGGAGAGGGARRAPAPGA